jgi:response regulator of citrate/malate metabolism
MDKDKIIEFLLESGVDQHKIEEIINIAEGKIKEPQLPEGMSKISLIEQLRSELIGETDVNIKIQKAAKILSLSIDE